jgi:hypothetical protein
MARVIVMDSVLCGFGTAMFGGLLGWLVQQVMAAEWWMVLLMDARVLSANACVYPSTALLLWPAKSATARVLRVC